MRTCTAALAAVILGACTHGGDVRSAAPAPPAPSYVDRNVHLRLEASGKYLSADQGGGGKLSADRERARGAELFTIRDLDGGELQSGDTIALLTASGRYVTVGADATLSAAGQALDASTTFRLTRVAGPGIVAVTDAIGFQHVGSGRWLSVTDGALDARGASLGASQSWKLEALDVLPPPPPTVGWKLVWQDEFDGAAIDEAKWTYEVQPPGWVNEELQSYTDHRRENARIEDGRLVIEGRRDGFGGHAYSSARLKTAGKASWLYGRFEARLKLPTGHGPWPAFWLMPDDCSEGWPACGEIDAMEQVGFEPDRIHASTHSGKYNWKNGTQATATTLVTGATAGFHVYALEWRPGRIDAYVDGRRYFTALDDGGGHDAWPFTRPFYIILNLAIGGGWGGAQGVDESIWPQRYEVDYVRVYQAVP
jgi:beta-glucanase (GH16 family)